MVEQNRYLDKITKKDIKAAKKHHLKNCPFPDGCMPNAWSFGSNEAGVCAGLILNVEHLDCVRLCTFFENVDTKGIDYHENFMTPDEALAQARILILTAENAINGASSYDKYYKQLCRIRKKEAKNKGVKGNE